MSSIQPRNGLKKCGRMYTGESYSQNRRLVATVSQRHQLREDVRDDRRCFGDSSAGRSSSHDGYSGIEETINQLHIGENDVSGVHSSVEAVVVGHCEHCDDEGVPRVVHRITRYFKELRDMYLTFLLSRYTLILTNRQRPPVSQSVISIATSRFDSDFRRLTEFKDEIEIIFGHGVRFAIENINDLCGTAFRSFIAASSGSWPLKKLVGKTLINCLAVSRSELAQYDLAAFERNCEKHVINKQNASCNMIAAKNVSDELAYQIQLNTQHGIISHERMQTIHACVVESDGHVAVNAFVAAFKSASDILAAGINAATISLVDVDVVVDDDDLICLSMNLYTDADEAGAIGSVDVSMIL